MTLHWSWGLSTALLLALVIHLNGKGIRVGWLLGATVQAVNLGFGYFVYGQWTFLFLAIPATMFLINWARHPARMRRTAAFPRPRKGDDPRCTSVIARSLAQGDHRCQRVADHDGPHVDVWIPEGDLEATSLDWGDAESQEHRDLAEKVKRLEIRRRLPQL